MSVLGTTSRLDVLCDVQQTLFDAQWETAIISAHCHATLAQRKAEMREEVRPWTEAVASLYECTSKLSEQHAIVHDAQSTIRAIRQSVREEESQLQYIAGASSSEVQGSLRDQDARRHLLEIVDELFAVCASVSGQIQEMDKSINSVLC